MKPIYLTLTTLLFTSLVFAGPAPQKINMPTIQKVDIQELEKKLSEVLALEQKQEYFEALLISMNFSAQILNQLRVDEVVAYTESTLTEFRQEVITNRYTAKNSFSALFGLISGGSSVSTDTAKIITTNEKEVSEFPGKIKTDFTVLQNKLMAYVRNNELGLAYAKAFALETARLATLLPAQSRDNLLPLIKHTIQFSQRLQFFGEQSIVKCLETHYADRVKSSSYSLGGLLLSLDISSEKTQLAHTEQSCSSSSNTTSLGEGAIMSVKLSKLDILIASSLRQLGLLEVVEAKAEPYQTWGSPYYK